MGLGNDFECFANMDDTFRSAFPFAFRSNYRWSHSNGISNVIYLFPKKFYTYHSKLVAVMGHLAVFGVLKISVLQIYMAVL